jgi:pyruvate dehydrogenase E1 component
MYVDRENVCYYLTVGNEPYEMPDMPDGVRDGILKGAYRFRTTGKRADSAKVKLLGSGAIMNQVLQAQEMLKEFGVASEVWAVTSYQQLFREGLSVERWNRLHPKSKARVPYVERCFGGDDDAVVVATSDYVKALPCSIRDWISGDFVALGTDGFGFSEGRRALRDHFEVDARHVAYATLESLARAGRFDSNKLGGVLKQLEIDTDRPDPAAR